MMYGNEKPENGATRFSHSTHHSHLNEINYAKKCFDETVEELYTLL